MTRVRIKKKLRNIDTKETTIALETLPFRKANLTDNQLIVGLRKISLRALAILSMIVPGVAFINYGTNPVQAASLSYVDTTSSLDGVTPGFNENSGETFLVTEDNLTFLSQNPTPSNGNSSADYGSENRAQVTNSSQSLGGNNNASLNLTNSDSTNKGQNFYTDSGVGTANSPSERVPEPLTILGVITAGGMGLSMGLQQRLKRKKSKNV
ncbi:MAG: hypothetical protein ACFB02_22190 [Mastigocoleus sp.]